MELARALWVRIETVHAVTYFGQETTDAGAGAGVGGFWAGYFAFRAAPMGAVAAGAVEAAFANFAPEFVRRWVPEVWTRVSPADAVTIRSAAAVGTLRRLVPAIAEVADDVNPLLRSAALAGTTAGRPLFAANVALPCPEGDPVAELWHWATCLREHRGDGHVAALTAAGVDGVQAHVLISLEQGSSPEDLQRTRGWSPGDWSDALGRCRAAGWVDGSGALSASGRELRAEVERTTDRLAAAPYEASGVDVDRLARTLGPAAAAISSSGTIRYPNPMGLPPAHELVA